MSDMVSIDSAAVAEDAIDTLAEDLIDEVFEHADRFIRSNDQLNYWAIFQWLAQIEEENGLVSEATVGTSGSRWLLARQLGDTLQATVDQIMQFTAAERAIHDMTQVFAFASVMNLWNLNDLLNEDGPLGDVLKASKVQGQE